MLFRFKLLLLFCLVPCSWRQFHSLGAVQKEAQGSCLCKEGDDFAQVHFPTALGKYLCTKQVFCILPLFRFILML